MILLILVQFLCMQAIAEPINGPYRPKNEIYFSDFTPQEMLTVNTQAQYFEVLGKNGKVMFHLDLKSGKSTVDKDADEAARTFWRAVVSSIPCKVFK